jgi:Calx-beta domain
MATFLSFIHKTLFLNEGLSALFQVRLSAPSASTVTVSYGFQAGTAIGSDWSATAGTLTFLPGQDTQLFSLFIPNDTVQESTESFHIVFSNAVNATLLSTHALGVIGRSDVLAETQPRIAVERTDRLIGVERIVFADQMLAFGARAEEIARLAFVLWTKDIVSSGTLFSRGYSFYDVGYDFITVSEVALQFWTADNDTALAERLIRNSGSTKTVAQLLATMAAAGGAIEGRAAALREIALDEGTTAHIVASGIRDDGVVAENFVPGFGQLFQLFPG